MNLLGIDPGMKRLGLAVYDAQAKAFRHVRVVQTERSDRKTSRAASDGTTRARELARVLGTTLVEWDVRAICAEELCPVRNASAFGKISISWGVVAALAEVAGLPILEIPPKDLKRRVAGNAGASKEEVQAAMEGRHPELAGMWPRGPRGGGELLEHAADAAGAAWCGSFDDVVIAMLAATRTR